MCINACKYSTSFTKHNFGGLYHPLCSLCNKSLICISVVWVLLHFRCGIFLARPSDPRQIALLIAQILALLLLSSAATVNSPTHPNNHFLPSLYCSHQDLPFLWYRKFLYPDASLMNILFFSTSLLCFVPACHSLLSFSPILCLFSLRYFSLPVVHT